MHDYAVFGHNRATIGRWLGVTSVIVTGGLSSLFLWMQQETGLEVFGKAVITTAVVYFILHWLFNKFVWKVPFFSIPDISGIWSVRGETLTEDGDVKFNWTAEVDIEQTWEKISINLKTAQSSSSSYTATLGKNREPKVDGFFITVTPIIQILANTTNLILTTDTAN